MLSAGVFSEAPGDLCAYAATAVLTKTTAVSVVIFFIALAPLYVDDYFGGFSGAGPDLLPGSPGTLLWSWLTPVDCSF
jgi:hypothetical protein